MKKVLIVSPYFAPENSTASVRFTKIGKYLSKMGYDVSVICTQMKTYPMVDKTLENDLKYFSKVYRINYPKLLYYGIKKKFGVEKNPEKDNEDKKNSAKDVVLYKPGTKLFDAIVQLHIFMCDFLLARRYIKFIKKNNLVYDVVITTFTPIAPHRFGHYMKKKFGCVWIADFRDTFMTLVEENFVTRWIERAGSKLINTADYITTVSNGTMESLCMQTMRHGVDISNKIVKITNGYDQEDRRSIKNVKSVIGKLIFSYCGTIYNLGGTIMSDISPIFFALSNLIERNLISHSNVEIHYAGPNKELFLYLASKAGIERCVVIEGILNREDSLKVQKKSDIVLVAIPNNKGEKGILSGKFFETILVQRNVLCIVCGDQQGSELGTIIEENNFGFVYEKIENNDSQLWKLENWILERYNEKLNSGMVAYHADELQQAQYSHAGLAKKFVELFRG